MIRTKLTMASANVKIGMGKKWSFAEGVDVIHTRIV
jgi:hypothetical protein